MSISIQILLMLAGVVVFRILLNQFCEHTEAKVRMGYAAGMMIQYTILLLQMVYIAGVVVEEMSQNITINDFVVYLGVLIFSVNIVYGFIILVYYSTAKKRGLSNREKIMLKDL